MLYLLFSCCAQSLPQLCAKLLLTTAAAPFWDTHKLIIHAHSQKNKYFICEDLLLTTFFPLKLRSTTN